jgi:Icc-related predicted phosphoesterase
MPLSSLFSRRRRRADDGRLRLYYASDVHGSDLCWRKFLNAGRHYDCDALVMGGDLCGKGMVPIERGEDDVWKVVFLGEERLAHDAAGLDELERAVRMNGFYPVRVSAAEHERMRTDPKVAEDVFARAMLEELERWVALAEERVAGGAPRPFVMPGNDDPFTIDEVLERADGVTACDGRIVRVGEHEMVSVGYSNPTPWDTPRELAEDDLYRLVRRLADQLEHPGSSIFNLHVPPHDSGLDTAVELDEEFRPVVKSGRPKEIPVGSTAVRQIIEEVQPMLALHGHIHESRGISTLGRTVAINPGSDYAGGRIDGCVVETNRDRVTVHQLVSG